MQIITECNLAKIVVDLLDGNTIIFPTETSYGLGCDATNKSAVEKIFAIKGRPSNKPLLIVVPTIAMAKKYLVWNDIIEKIAQQYWPGPLTIVGEAKLNTGLVPGVVAIDGTVAVRVTAFELTRSITEKMDRPLVATSANITNAGDVYSAEQAIKMFQSESHQPDMILDYGVLPKALPTTIVQVAEKSFSILRQGEIIVSL